MRKRTLLSWMVVAPLVSACGFQLRQAPRFAFRSLYVEGAASRELVRALATAGADLQVLLPPAARAEADVVLHMLGESTQRVVLSKTVSGQIREVELRLSQRFKLTDRAGQLWIAETELGQKRDMSYSESLALAKDEETLALQADMRRDIAQQIVRRLTQAHAPVEE